MKEQNHPNVIKIMKRPTISESEDTGGTIKHKGNNKGKFTCDKSSVSRTYGEFDNKI